MGAILALLILGCIALFGWAIFRLFGMWITDKVISGWEFVLILSLMLALLGGTLMGGPVAIGLFLLLMVVCLLITVMPLATQEVGTRRLEAQDIARYYEALERQPDVPFPHRKLGEIYEQRGDLDRAIEHYQAYVEIHSGSADIQRRLERCLDARRRRDMHMQRCPVCGAYSPQDAVRCTECGMYLKGSVEIIETLTTPEMMRLWKWLIVVFLVPAVVIGLLAEWIPPMVSLIMLAVSIVATIFFIFGRMRG
ncbi:MAG: tetratricopeptide repeat protein [Armatimonadota bacterium]|nr:tetratricopeptide repeat protein [Armatimonadota bacterium]